MYKAIFLKLLIIAILNNFVLNTFADKKVSKEFFKEFSKIAVQDEGRLKPIKTFSRVYLTLFYGKSKIKNSKKITIDSVQWLWHLLVDFNKMYKQNDFVIRNPELLHAFNIDIKNDEHKKYFNFDELKKAVGLKLEKLQTISTKDKKSLSRLEKQMLEMYNKLLIYINISKSLSSLTKSIAIKSEYLAQNLKKPIGKKLSYWELIQERQKFEKLITEFEHQGNSEEEKIKSKALVELVFQLRALESDRSALRLNIIPPDKKDKNQKEWYSVWEILDGRELSTFHSNLLENLHSAIEHYQEKNYDKASQYLKEFNLLVEKNTTEIYPSWRKNYEVLYEKIDAFYKNLILYILVFLLILIAFLFKNQKLIQISRYLFYFGLLIHFLGIVLRMILMSRPPVSTLYESIIFVGFIGVLTCAIFEHLKKDGLGILLGTITGICLHFIGLKYASDGDSMGVLVAVLNSNFWLATHVVTITIGYGCTLIAGLFGHAYLFLSCLKKHSKKTLAQYSKTLLVLALVSLFFTILGTILGGIWADQSWGRFWGWDPKENGALLIVLWLVISVHGKISGYLKNIGFAVMLSLGNITVALAWFGVNLLNAGLHSRSEEQHV